MKANPPPTFPNGTPSSNTRKVRTLYSMLLPKSTSPLCRSIAAFTRRLLDLNTRSSEVWKSSPTSTDFLSGCHLPSSALLHPINQIPESACALKSENIPPIFRAVFVQDLENSNFPGVTFAWDHPWESPWNQLFAQFILKHWRNASRLGVFKVFYIDPVEAANPDLQMGVLHRWFLGRSDGFRLGKFSPLRQDSQKRSELKSKFRIQLQKHRQETLLELPTSQEARQLFDMIKCSSETEMLPDKSLIKKPLAWRSAEFTLLAQQLDQIHIHKKTNTKGQKHVKRYSIETRRAVSTSPTPPVFSDVPRSLPVNCYSQEYMNSLSESQKMMLEPKAQFDFPVLLKITKENGEYGNLQESSKLPHE